MTRSKAIAARNSKRKVKRDIEETELYEKTAIKIGLGAVASTAQALRCGFHLDRENRKAVSPKACQCVSYIYGTITVL